MDHAALVALFRRIVLASAPLLAGGCFSEDHQCNTPERADHAGDHRDRRCAAGCRASPISAGKPSHSPTAISSRHASWSRPTAARPSTSSTSRTAWATPPRGVHLAGAGRAARSARCLARGLRPPGGGIDRCVRNLGRRAGGASRAAAVRSRRRATRPRTSAATPRRRPASRAPRPSAPPGAHGEKRPRDIETIARENAVEGCTRETYAALLASRQACTATDPAIRAAMTGIRATRPATRRWPGPSTGGRGAAVAAARRRGA